ncbi:integrase core domain protein [Aphelenchoides avenae]|nr:integrase core domain protein [Aphelenchus avenae]
MENMLLTMGKQRFFSSLDLMGAYWQLPLDEESSKYTAFAALGRQYQYNVLAMGLCGAPAYFQQTMNRVFEGMIGKSVLVYLDDVLVLGETWEEHVRNLREVFERLRRANLKLKATKCR